MKSNISKEKKKKIILATACAVLVLCAVSIALNIIQFCIIKSHDSVTAMLENQVTGLESQVTELETQVASLEKENKGLNLLNDKYLEEIRDYKDMKEKIDFYDETIVFVIDGYGKYYYTYDQMMIVTQGIGQYSFWAYNIEAAKSQGYIAWQ